MWYADVVCKDGEEESDKRSDVAIYKMKEDEDLAAMK